MPVANTKTQALMRMARLGPIRARDLSKARIPRAYLKRLCDRGQLERIDRGVYQLVNAPITELHSLAQVAKKVPHATVCLLSALQVHELTTEMPHAVWLLINRNARTPKVATPALRIVRASGRALSHGVEDREIEHVPVRVTTPAKTVADCFRYRRHVGLDVALAALRDYLAKSQGKPTKRERSAERTGAGYGHGGHGFGTSRGDGYGDPRTYSVDALIEAARADRIYSFLRPYLEASV